MKENRGNERSAFLASLAGDFSRMAFGFAATGALCAAFLVSGLDISHPTDEQWTEQRTERGVAAGCAVASCAFGIGGIYLRQVKRNLPQASPD